MGCAAGCLDPNRLAGAGADDKTVFHVKQNAGNGLCINMRTVPENSSIFRYFDVKRGEWSRVEIDLDLANWTTDNPAIRAWEGISYLQIYPKGFDSPGEYMLLDGSAVILGGKPVAMKDESAQNAVKKLPSGDFLLRRLAAHCTDATTAGILNRQGRKTARGLRFTATRVASLRQHWRIPGFRRSKKPPESEPVTVEKAAKVLGVVPSTVHRWLQEGFIAGEQVTPGAPWRIRMNEAVKTHFVETTPEGYVPMIEATKLLGVTRQTVLQRVKRGEIEAVHGTHGRRKGLRIKVIDNQPELFGSDTSEGV